MFRGFIKDLASPSNLWTVFQYCFPAGAGAVSLLLSHFWKLPPSLTLCAAFMTAAAALVIAQVVKENSAFNKIGIETFQPVHYLFNEQDEMAMVQYKAIFKSEFDEPIYYDADVLSFALQNKTNQEPKVGDVALITPQGRRNYLLPMIEGIKFGEVKGRAHIRVKYGKDSKNLKYTMELRYLFQGMMLRNNEGKAGIVLNTVLESMVSH